MPQAMPKGARETYEQILKEAKEDARILGLILTGSRGKGRQTEYSDYDIYLIVKDGEQEDLKRKYRKYRWVPNKTGVEVVGVLGLTEFDGYAKLGTPIEWEGYAFAHLKAQVDKTNGDIQRMIDEKSRIPKDKLRGITEEALEGYINYVCRSLKCMRDGNQICALLEAQGGIRLFIKVLFALDERKSPYYKYLEWELRNYPIRQFPLNSDELLDCLMKVAVSADLRAQQRLLKATRTALGKKEYEHVFKAWKRNLSWMERFTPPRDS